MRDVGFGKAPGDARIPKAPRLAAEGHAGPFENPMRFTNAPTSSVVSFGILRASTRSPTGRVDTHLRLQSSFSPFRPPHLWRRIALEISRR
jgi:hypothetical protein